MESLLNTQLLLCSWCRIHFPCLLWLLSAIFPSCFSQASFWKDSSRVVGISLVERTLHYGILIVSYKCYPMDMPQVYGQELQTTRASFLPKLCQLLLWPWFYITTERVPIKPDWNGNEETVLSLFPCSENVRTKACSFGKMIQKTYILGFLLHSMKQNSTPVTSVASICSKKL